MYKHILLPTDGSERSQRAIAAGIELARALNARVTGIFVSASSYIPSLEEGVTPRAEEALAVISQQAQAAGVTSHCVSMLGDLPQDAIAEFARTKNCDLIIMGTHGRSKVGKFFLGSVAAAVLADCEIPVLLYR